VKCVTRTPDAETASVTVGKQMFYESKNLLCFFVYSSFCQYSPSSFYLQEISMVSALGSCFPSRAASHQQTAFPPAGRMLRAPYLTTASNGVSLISLKEVLKQARTDRKQEQQKPAPKI